MSKSLHTKSSYVSLDTETTGTAPFHGSRPFAVSLAWRENWKIKTRFFEWFVNPKTRQPIIPKSDVKLIREILYDFNLYVFHNAKFDIRMLELIGVFQPTVNIDKQSPHYKVFCNRIHDTLIMSHVLDSMEDHGLKPLALKYLDFPEDDQKELRKKIISLRAKAKRKGWNTAEFGKTPGLSSSDSAWAWDMWLPRAFDKSDTSLKRYGVNDAIRTLRLFEVFTSALEQEKLIHLYEEERKLIPIFYEMETIGLPIRPKRLHRLRKTISTQADIAEQAVIKISKRSTFNIRSNLQLQKLLYKKLRLPIIEVSDRGNPSCDKQTIIDLWKKLGNTCDEDGMDREFVKDVSASARVLNNLLAYRIFSTGVKYLDSYNSLSLPEKNRAVLYPSFNQTGTRTTRLSASNPNPTNVSTGTGSKVDIPLREIFCPRQGTFWYDADYSNLELRIFAFLTKDKILRKAFEQGISVHAVIAERLWKIPADTISDKNSPHYWKYKRTKNFVFCLIYGGGEKKADDTIGIPGAYRRFRKEFPAIDRFMDETINGAKTLGYTVTLDGYRLWVDRHKEYAAVNYRIQGTAGRLIKRAMINLRFNEFKVPLGQRPQLLLQVHDELILQSRELVSQNAIARWIKSEMEEPGQRIGIVTPVEVSIIRDSWAHPEKLEL